MIQGAPANILDYGAVADGVTDCSAALQGALESGRQQVFIPAGTFAISTNVVATIATDVTVYGHGRFLYTGATDNVNPLISIETGNNSLTVDGLSFDGDNKIAAGVNVKNTATPDSNTLPNCTISNNQFIRFRMNVTGIWNEAAYVSGSYQLVTIANNRVRLITRAAGTGSPGNTGTSGMVVAQYDNSKFIRECMHYGNQYAAIVGDDLVGSANNVDYDGFKFFGPAPSGSPNSYAQSTITSYGNVYRNCRGRAIKIQAIGSVNDETIIRDDDYTIFGGSTEINFQFGVGMVSNCQFIYKPYGTPAVSPLQTGLAVVSFFQGADYGEDTGSAMVNGIQIFNSIPAGLGNNIGQIVSATTGTGVATPTKPLISISNVSVNKNPVDWIATIGFEATTYGTIRLDNVIVPELIYSAIGTNGTDTNFDIVATNVMNIDGVSTPANAKPFVTSTTGTPIVYGGAIFGGINQGFLASYAVGNSSTNKGPLLGPSALSDPLSAAGGAVSVQSKDLADDATFEFDARFFNTSRGLFAVSVNFEYTTQGLFATSGNAIYLIAAATGDLFEVSTAGTNPDVDGRFNMWYTGGKLNVKNRLGGSYVATVTFLG
jgi:hypothetical protein